MKFTMACRSRLFDSGLHQDEAEFGGRFEDEFAVAPGVGGIVEGDELVGDGAAAAGELGDASAQGVGRGRAALGTAGLTEELADGFEKLGGVLGDNADVGGAAELVEIEFGRVVELWQAALRRRASAALFFQCFWVSRTFGLVGARTQSRRRRTVMGSMTLRYSGGR